MLRARQEGSLGDFDALEPSGSLSDGEFGLAFADETRAAPRLELGESGFFIEKPREKQRFTYMCIQPSHLCD